MLLSVVVPVYNEEKNVPEFLRRTIPVLENLMMDYEIIFAMDPSSDQTEQVILEYRRQNPRIKFLKFSRRVGQPMAILAGLQYSVGDAVVVIDVDLQDPPELINDMVKKWQEGFDVVMVQRRSRKGETLTKRLTAYFGYRLINKIAEVNIPRNTGDFRLMSRKVVQEVCRLKECHGFLRGLVALVGFKQTSIVFDRPPRYSGKGNYNRLFGSMRIGFDGVIGFSKYPLTLSSQLGFLCAGAAFLIAFGFFIARLFGVPFPTGIPTLVILIMFLGGIQLIGIGILGEYIGRIYDEVRQRPKFIVDQALGFSEDQSSEDRMKETASDLSAIGNPR